jgi:HEAT repeat protein
MENKPQVSSPTPSLKRTLEGIPDHLPPEEIERLQKIQSRLNDFVLRLIQAFLRTGYYTPDHPESKKAKEGLYQEFKTLFEGKDDEISFLVKEDQQKQEIVVEGILPEAQRLSRMMMRGMGELYVPKFAKFLERKDLISLTLKSRMGQTEFTRFVDLMSEPSLVDTRQKRDQDRFTEALAGRGIIHISYVFNEEMLAPDREMPWRARLTLSRMRKDLKMIPVFHKVMGQEMKDIRINLLRDSLRPIRQSDLLCAILKNSDLASSADYREETLEDDILASLPKLNFMGVSKIFLREHLTLKQLKKQDAFEVKSDRMVKKIGIGLKALGTKESENLLEEYFRNQLIRLEDLSPELKDKILLERLTDKFLAYTAQFFQQLNQAKEQEAFLAAAGSFVKMIPELIRRDRYSEIHRILETVKFHFHQKTMWALLAGHVIEEIGRGEIPLMLEEKFLSGKKEIRSAIIPVFASLEIGAIPHLLSILRKSKDQWVRKNACEALIQIGQVAAAHLFKELNQPQSSVETTCDILRVLGEIKAREWKAPLTEALKKHALHGPSKLKEQALHTLCQVAGREEEEIFLSSLDDPDIEVRKKAVWCLGIIKSQKGAEKMMEILKQISATPSPDLEQLEAHIYYAFGSLGNLLIEGKTAEQFLLQILEKRGIKRIWGLFQKNLIDDASLSAICDSLAKIGTKESIGPLTRLGKTREGPWIMKLKEALKKIEQRSPNNT